MTRLLTASICALVAALLLAAAPAQASTGQTLYFDTGGELRDPTRRAAALAELESLGVRALRVVLYWRDVAPSPNARRKPRGIDTSDPAAYNWGQYDAVMAEAAQRGWDVLLTPSAPAPKWSTSRKRDFVTRPSPREFQRFVTALGRRYGPQVRMWSAWNEPNHPDFLKPQLRRRKGNKIPLSPGHYRKLVFAMDRGLRASGNGRDRLLYGETAPRGTGKVVAPLTFLRRTACLTERYRRVSRRCKRLPVDGVANHPYTTKAGIYFVPPQRNDVTFGALSRLTRAVSRMGRTGMVKRGLPIYVTEFGIQSTPDRYFGVSLARQVEYRALAERLAWGNRRIRAFSQYLLRDDLPTSPKPGRSRYGGFETGLRFSTGRPKPSLSAFRLTLSALKKGRTASLWGVVRPATGATTADVLYQNRGQKRFRKLRTVRTNSRGYFTLRTAYRKGRRYRLRWERRQGYPVRVLPSR